MSKRIEFLGCKVDKLSMSETLSLIENTIKKRIPLQHVVINASKTVSLQNDKELREIINQCGIINADGQSIVWASRFLGQPLPERVAGIDLMYKLVELAADKGYRIFFLGAKEEIVKKTVDTFKCTYNNLQIAGYRNGYWKPNEEGEIINNIRESNADILFVAISSPKKEYFLGKYMDQMQVPFCMGVGGSFDVVAGLTQRAPVWMQKMGLEWFYRLIQEPQRMWKRYLIGNLQFIILVLNEKMRRRTSI